MSRVTLGLIVRYVALALMASALLVVGCRNAPVTMTEEPPPPDRPDPNAGIAWRLIRTGGGLESPSGTTGDQLRSVAWGAGRFVAVGLNGTIAHSPDGVTWTRASAPATDERLSDVTWGGGRFVANAIKQEQPFNMVVRSGDGDAWEKVSDLSNTGYLSDAAYGNGRFVAVSGDSTMEPGADKPRHGPTKRCRSIGSLGHRRASPPACRRAATLPPADRRARHSG